MKHLGLTLDYALPKSIAPSAPNPPPKLSCDRAITKLNLLDTILADMSPPPGNSLQICHALRPVDSPPPFLTLPRMSSANSDSDNHLNQLPKLKEFQPSGRGDLGGCGGGGLGGLALAAQESGQFTGRTTEPVGLTPQKVKARGWRIPSWRCHHRIF